MGSHHLGLIVALLAGCAPLPHVRMEGWPEMRTTVHIVAPGEIAVRCYAGIPLGMRLLGALPVACAHMRWAAGECDIYVAEPVVQATLDHERMHCDGWTHSVDIAEQFQSWRASVAKEE